MDEDLSVYELIKEGEARLTRSDIGNAFDESIVLMKYALKKSMSEVIISYGDKLDKNKVNLFEKLIKRRGRKEPYAYITNKKEFYSLDFFVDGSVLIPRPDTECLVDEVLKEIEKFQNELNRKIYILDIGTGSGAVAISIAKNSYNVIIYAADNSIKSLNVAKKNIKANRVEKKVIPVYFDMLKSKKTNLSLHGFDIYDFDNFDIIVSNPPYIETDELKILDDGIKFYEPPEALDGGEDGLKFYRKIFDTAILHSRNKKSIILEIDYRKKSAIYSLFEKKFTNYNGIKFKRLVFANDLNNKERVTKITYG
ncbi:peptide chain release factor N(5)-glutamine methyltransferase [Candidatus Acidulodesulfobacterium sp. H_13]|uniref:peptide chain release factor N(5)-glutamine methyltransferase n=1 Tax=Candidatus Acidulodesulfobacterium sp. H_13 TaxID=3395470 RepID=UPI003AF5DD47